MSFGPLVPMYQVQVGLVESTGPSCPLTKVALCADAGYLEQLIA